MDELDSLNLFVIIYISLADVAELADAIDLGSIVNRRAGSIPVIRINGTKLIVSFVHFVLHILEVKIEIKIQIIFSVLIFHFFVNGAMVLLVGAILPYIIEEAGINYSVARWIFICICNR